MTHLPLLFLLSACSNHEVEAPIYSGEWDKPTWDMLDDLGLPSGPDGQGYTVLPGPDGQELWADTSLRDETTEAAACGALVLACVNPPERNVLGCLQNIPICPEDEICCPQACEEQYVQERRSGKEPAESIVDAIWGEDSCMPGWAQ